MNTNATFPWNNATTAFVLEETRKQMNIKRRGAFKQGNKNKVAPTAATDV